MKRRKTLSKSCVLVVCLWAGYIFLGGQVIPRPRRADATSAPARKPAVSYAKVPLSLEANQGQTDSRVKFLSHGPGYGLFLAGDEAVLTLRSPRFVVRGPLSPRGGIHDLLPRTPNFGFTTPDQGLRVTDNGPRMPDSVVRLQLVGANPNATLAGEGELPGRANYFIGRDPKQWRTNVPAYARVRYQDVYPGIDLVCYGNEVGQLEYDFVVAPGADPQAITLAVGAQRQERNSKLENRNSVVRTPLRIAEDGDLVIPTEGGDVRLRKPMVYQLGSGQRSAISIQQRLSAGPVPRTPNPISRALIEAHYVLTASNQVRFGVDPYDHTQPLVIDPVLFYSTNLGGSHVDVGRGVAVDSSGSAYVTGETSSTDFPTVNPLQATKHAVDGTAFVAKLNAAGSALLYSTYLGGSLTDNGASIAVDSFGNALVTGSTQSTDFPTMNPLQASLSGIGDAFVTKLNATGSALIYSTYLGGSQAAAPGISISSAATSIAVDPSGNAYVTGETDATDFPAVNPIQSTCRACSAGSGNAFVAELSSAGSALVYSTYLGGSFFDYGYGIAVDSSGNAYVTGENDATDFPAASPIQASPGGIPKAFVVKIAGSPAPGPGVTLSTHRLPFSNDPVGTMSSVESVILRSVGADSLTITKIAISGDFALALTGSSCPYSGGTVASGTDCTIDVTFTPTEMGTLIGSVTIDDNASDSPQSVSLTGTGVASGPQAAVSPATLTFGPQWVNSVSAPQPVTLSNTGNAPLSVTSIVISGMFTQTNNCGSSVAAGSSCTINVAFAPIQGGLLPRTLIVTDNSNGIPNSTQTVSLNGTYQNFIMTWVSRSSSSLTIPPGGSASYTWAVAAVGGFNQPVNFSCGIAPSDASCTISPSVVTPSSTPANITVTIPVPSASVLRTLPPVQPRLPRPKVLLVFAALLASAAWKGRGWRQAGASGRRTSLVSLAGGLLLTVGLAGCGVESGGGGGGDPTSVVPTGTYYILTVTGTASSGSTTLTNSTNIELYVPK